MLSAVSQQIQAIQESLKEYGRRSDSECWRVLRTRELEQWAAAHMHGVLLVCHTCSFAAGVHSKPVVVDLVGRQVKVSQDTGIFITMNPDYAGRSNLPDNLKQLFRSLAMTKPDRQLIAEVMLYSQGFKKAERLAAKAVPFFKWVPYMCVFLLLRFVWAVDLRT